MDILWDVDTQHDFCSKTGSLFVPGADKVRINQAKLVDAAERANIIHLATADDHEYCDEEISFVPDYQRTFPPHCMRGTQGARKIPETTQHDPVVLGSHSYSRSELSRLLLDRREILFLKKHFNIFVGNGNADTVLRMFQPKRIFLFGVATDVCVKAAVEGLMDDESIELYVIEDACAGLDEEASKNLMYRWAEQHAEVITTSKALEMLGQYAEA